MAFIKTSKFLSTLSEYWAMLIALGVASFASYIAINYLGQPLMEQHAFRQTQTALTSYWMQQEGWQFDYQTPVGGYPWKLPFEFPFYQAIVAFISSTLNTSLSATGRLVSFVFLILCAIPAVKIGKELNFKKEVAWVFCALLWSSPLYLFWGRTFMIEMSTLFFALMTLCFGFVFLKEKPAYKKALLFILFASLGMLQKITTVAPVLLILSLIILVHHLKTEGFKFPKISKMIVVFVSFLTPIIIGLAWVKYTDYIKNDSLFGASLTSSALSKWNYGTWEMRTNLEVVKRIFWERVVSDNIAGFLGLSLVLLSLVFGTKKNRTLIGLCLLLFVLPIAIFLNLHFVHNYYQTACTIFLIAAVAISVFTLGQKINDKIPFSPLIVLLLVGYNIYSFNNGYKKIANKNFDITTNKYLKIAEIIKLNTSENSASVIFGADWSSTITYHAERKMFTVPSWFKGYDSVYKYPERFIGDKKLGAVVFNVQDNVLPSLMQREEIVKDSSLYKIQKNFFIWLPGVKKPIIPTELLKTESMKNVYK